MKRIYLKHLVEIDRIGCLKLVEIDKRCYLNLVGPKEMLNIALRNKK